MEMCSVRMWALSVLLVFLAGCVGAPKNVSVKELAMSPSKYDGNTVIISGIVHQVTEEVTRRGNAYFVFQLNDGDYTVAVFSTGKPTISNGDNVCVTGTFAREKRVCRYTFHDIVLMEIDASKGSIKTSNK